MTLHHCVILALIAPAMAMTHETTSATSPNAPTRDECPGQWVKTRDIHTISYNADGQAGQASTAAVSVLNQAHANPVSGEESRYGVQVDQTRIEIDQKIKRRGRGAEASRKISASRVDYVQYEWQPPSCPIQNKVVLVNFFGEVELLFNTSTTDHEIRDFASATASIAANAKGNVGNQDIAVIKGDGASDKFTEDVGGWSRITGISGQSSAGFTLRGSIDLSKDAKADPVAAYTGSIGAAAGYVGNSSTSFSGAANSNGKWTVTVSHDKSANTNNHPVYYALLSQTLTCVGQANASSAIFSTNESNGNSSAKSTIIMASPQ